MRNGLFGAITALLLSARLAAAHLPPPSSAPTPLSPYAVQQTPAPTPAPPPGSVDAPPIPPPPPPAPADFPPPADDFFRPTQAASAYPNFAWVDAEYLLWAFKNGRQPPPLVTTGPATADNPAALTDPQTVVLFPTQGIDYEAVSGGRWAVGTWFNACQSLGGEVTGLYLQKQRTLFRAVSDGNGSPVLGIPFADAQSGTELVNFASFPGRFAGGIEASTRAQLWGMEGTLYSNWDKSVIRIGGSPLPLGDLRIDALGGFRYLSLSEAFDLTQPSLELAGGVTDFLGAAIQTGDVEVIRDAFAARSQFFGGQIGLRSEFDRGPFYAEFTGKVGLGDSHESVLVSGATTLLPAATHVPAVATGGFLATTTNIGRKVRDRFAVVPEAGVNLGYQPCPLVRLFVGYSFLYWSDVVRAADQIDRTVNLTAVPSSGTFGTLTGPARPAVPFRTSDFWAQGVNFGFELRY